MLIPTLTQRHNYTCIRKHINFMPCHHKILVSIKLLNCQHFEEGKTLYFISLITYLHERDSKSPPFNVAPQSPTHTANKLREKMNSALNQQTATNYTCIYQFKYHNVYPRVYKRRESIELRYVPQKHRWESNVTYV